MNNREIKRLAEHIEENVGVLLNEIERQKETILAKAKEGSLIGTEVKSFAKHIEKHVGILLEEIEKQKKAILTRAKEDALIELHNANKLSRQIIERTIQQTQNHLSAVKNEAMAPQLAETHPFDSIS